MFFKNNLTPFLCLIFFFLGFLYAQENLASNNTDSLWKSTKYQFQKGQYCKVLQTISMLPADMGDSLWVEKMLLETESWLELEQWDSTEKRLSAIEAAKPKEQSLQQLKHQLLKARFLAKKGQFQAAADLYGELMDHSPSGKEEKKWSAHVQVYYGLFQYETEHFEQSEQMLLKAKQYLESNDPMLAKCYRGLGNLYSYNSQTQLSEASFEKAKAIWEMNGWIRHPSYALLLNDYSLLYAGKSDFEVSETILSQAEAITNGACLIPSNKAYHEGARANIRLELGDYEEAEVLYQSVKNQFQALGQNKEVATALNMLGRIYFYIDSLDQAAGYYEQALDYYERSFGEGKPGFIKALILDGLAQVNDYAGNIEMADSLYQMEQSMLANTIGKDNIHYSTALNNHAFFYEYYEEYAKAVSLYEESLRIVEQIYGNKNPQYCTTLFNIARNYSLSDSTDVAIDYYRQANALQLELLDDYFSTYDEQTRLSYRLKAMGNFDVFFNFACFKNFSGATPRIQNLTLATKNLVLDYSIQTRAFSEEQSTEEVAQLRKDWEEARKLLARSYNLGLREREEFGLSTDSLERVVNRLETALIRALPERFSSARNFSSKDLSKKLKKGEASIDFLTFAYHDGYEFHEDSLFYFALVTRFGDAEPQLIELANNKQLEEIFDNYSHYTKNFAASYQLYQLIWQPLEAHLKGVKTIHLSPDGLLYQVSFGGLMTDEQDENQTLHDKYDLRYYSNLRDFLIEKERPGKDQSALLIGNPDFGPANSTKSLPGNRQGQPSEPIDRGTINYFTRLDGTKEELERIGERLNAKKYAIKVLEEKEASEEQFKTYVSQKSPSILHIATHGYFLEYDEYADSVENSYANRLKKSQNAMLRSGLAFSNANLTWRGQNTAVRKEDGLLNAQEAADLNLSKTNLVILSACETGLGKVTDGEGVFGLQRAFKLAGADQLVLSLWKIPDALTSELMDYFYEELLKGVSAQRALRNAQIKMKQSYPPFYWAGFVLFE